MKNAFQFGDWLVDPESHTIEAEGDRRQMEPRTMAVLVALCTARGTLLSSDELLTKCWGSTLSGDSPLHKNIAQLRRLLGDSASAPRYIETVRMRGYRTVAALDFTVPEQASRKHWHAGSPFRGLLAFDADHADVFFGRDDAIRQLVDAAAAQVASGLALLLVLGPSGSGKTSVIQAGLLPALTRAPRTAALRLLGSTTFDLFDQGEQTLFTALGGALLDLQWEDKWAFTGENATSLGLRLEHDCAGIVAELESALESAQARFGIFIDRFEALFNASRVDDAARAAFLRALDHLARSPAVLLVIACRNDFYPNIAQVPLLTENKKHGGHADLAPPRFADIAQMIRRPAAAARLRFDTDPATGASLDDVLCASAAGRPDALPLLQYCLHELYRLRTPEGVLGFDAFHELGDLEGAIGQRAEQVVLGLDDAQRAALDHIMSLVIILSPDGVNVSSQRVAWPALRDEAARQAVTQLIDARLFVSDLVGGTPVFGIAHDAILRRWPRMTGWIAAHRSALGVRSRLAQQTARWREEGRRNDLLLPSGKLLDEARALQQAGVWSLNDDECELIATSHRRERQRGRGRMAALVLMVALALLAVGMGISAQLAKRAEALRRSQAENLMDFMLGDFADKLRPLGRLDLLESVSGKALEYLSGSDNGDLSPASLTLRAKGLQTISEVSRSRGDSKQALDALQRARAILTRQLKRAPNDVQILKNLGANAYWVARIYKDQGRIKQAEAALQEYLHDANLMHQIEPNNPEWWTEQSYAHNNLGSLALSRGQASVAASEFTESIALKQRVLEKNPDAPSIAVELADSFSWLASTRESLGELDTAERLYAQEMEVIQRLRHRYPTESMWVYREVGALQHRAAIRVALGLDARALDDYEAAHRLFAPVVAQDVKNRTWQVELAGIEQARLRVLARHTNNLNIVDRLLAVQRTFSELLKLDPTNAVWAGREANSRLRLAGALPAQSPLQQEMLKSALSSLQSLHEKNPTDLTSGLLLAEALLLSSTMQKITDRDKAELNCREAYAIMSNKSLDTFDYQILDPWIRINFCLRNVTQVEITKKRLDKIGYRDSQYLLAIAK